MTGHRPQRNPRRALLASVRAPLKRPRALPETLPGWLRIGSAHRSSRTSAQCAFPDPIWIPTMALGPAAADLRQNALAAGRPELGAAGTGCLKWSAQAKSLRPIELPAGDRLTSGATESPAYAAQPQALARAV